MVLACEACEGDMAEKMCRKGRLVKKKGKYMREGE